MPISTIGQNGLNAPLSLTSPTISGNLSFASGTNGIVFNNSSALTNSTLNDYETGTVANPLVIAGTTITSGYGTNYARYTKIGNMVTCNYFVDYTAGSTGAVTINLPFTSGALVSVIFGLDIYSSQYGYAANALWIQQSATVAQVSYDLNVNNVFSLTAGNRFYMRSSFTYQTTF
jgi:hypothetical protein